jgi:ankyrin repeat protein
MKQKLLMDIREQTLSRSKIFDFNVIKHFWMLITDSSINKAIKDNNLVGLEFLLKRIGAKNKAIEKKIQTIALQNIQRDNINEVNYALQWAARNGHLCIVKCAIANGADMYGIKESLLAASKNGHLSIVKYLIEECNVNIHSNKGRDLMQSAMNGHLELVKYFIEKGAAINYYNHNCAELYGAAKNGHLKIVELLLNYVTNAKEIDESLEIAAKNGHLDIIKILLKYKPTSRVAQLLSKR